METCQQCKSQYDPSNVIIPTPIPDFMCANCGTQLTEEYVKQLINQEA